MIWLRAWAAVVLFALIYFAGRGVAILASGGDLLDHLPEMFAVTALGVGLLLLAGLGLTTFFESDEDEETTEDERFKP